MHKDDDVVSSVADLIKEWVKPFSDKQALVSISTAKTPSKDVA